MGAYTLMATCSLRLNYLRLANSLVGRLDSRIFQGTLKSEVPDFLRGNKFTSTQYRLVAEETELTYQRDALERSLILSRDNGTVHYDLDEQSLNIQVDGRREISRLYNGEVPCAFHPPPSLDLVTLDYSTDVIPIQEAERVFAAFTLEPFLVMTKD